MPRISPTSQNETTGDESGDYCPVFYNTFAQSAQSSETLQNALRHTDRKSLYVVCEHDRSTVFVFTICGWKRQDIFSRDQQLYRLLCRSTKIPHSLAATAFVVGGLNLAWSSSVCV